MAIQKTVMIFAVGLLLLIGTPLLAVKAQTTESQQPQAMERQEGRRGIKRKRLRDKQFGFGLGQLNLTAEQRQQTQVILQRHLESIRAQREELMQLRERRSTGTLTAEDQARAKTLHQQLRDARQGIQGELSNLLTAEQRTQLEQMESRRKSRREEKLKRRQELRDRLPE
jgi:Spy/CpxP family protein refolding chaperone